MGIARPNHSLPAMITAAVVSLFGICTTAQAQLSLEFDERTGAWSGIIVGGRNLVAEPSDEVAVRFEGGKLPPWSEWEAVSIDRNPGLCTTVRRAGDWEVVTKLAVNGAEIRRDVTFRWRGGKPVRIRGTEFRTPLLRLSGSPDDYFLIPGNFPVSRRTFGQLRDGRVTREAGWTRGDYGLAVMHSPGRRMFVIVGYVFRMDQARVSVREADGAVSVIHSFDTQAELKPGDEIPCGTQVLRFVGGDEEDLLPELARFSDSVGNGPPDDQPADLGKCVIQEVHPWGRLENWGSGDRGHRYSRLNDLLPYYDRLGVTCLWLLPVSWPPPWVYTLPAFDRIAPENGSPEELKKLIEEAHRRQMKVLIDLVVYGIKPDSEEVKRHGDDVWCYDEKGNRRIVWGGSVLAADCSHPEWQQRISEVVAHWAEDFGFDGARLDCIGWGQTANWRNTRRANASVAYGGLQLNRVVRDTFRSANPGGFILPEGGKPLVFRNADMVFDYPLYLAMRDITTTPDLGLWVSRLSEWLEFEHHCYPGRALGGIVRFLENHDTVAATSYFGVGPSQALMAICTLIQGTPLIYQEQEIGYSDDLADWLRLRNAEGCFYDGSADYRAVRCSDPNVFCFLRRSADCAAVVGVNMTGRGILCTLSWPSGLSREFPFLKDGLPDALAAAGAGNASVRIPPYRPCVLLLKRGSSATAPASESLPQADDARAKWREDADGAVVVPRARRWFLDCGEGHLEDRFYGYETKLKEGETLTAALPVLWRAWTPLKRGLLDGSSDALLGVEDDSGRRVCLVIDVAAAEEVVIDDPEGDGKDVRLVASPSQCRTVIDGKMPTVETPGIRAGGAGPGAAWAEVDPLFVRLGNGRFRMALARRHGGLPAEWTIGQGGAVVLSSLGDLYTDWGIYRKAKYVSADGDTNPRLAVEESGDSVSVHFRGRLHGRSWNGVQRCPTPNPACMYRLSYTLGRAEELKITVGITALGDLPKTSAFYALRLPLQKFRAWRCGSVSGRVGERRGQRLAELAVLNADCMEIDLARAALQVRAGKPFQNAFVIETGQEVATLFLCLLNGGKVDLKAGEELSATATLQLTGSDALGQ